MRAILEAKVLGTAVGQEAEAIIRSCVHCGFCNATCPTYELLGDELDGPRGRIYLIKSMLEGHAITDRTRRHLDRCLLCRACETTCPSGVRYGRLVELARPMVEHRAPRGLWAVLQRRLLGWGLPRAWCFATLLAAGRLVRPLLPANLRRRVPIRRAVGSAPQRSHARRVILMPGCVQRSAAPQIDIAAGQVFDYLDVELIHATGVQCCGALPLHLGDDAQARRMARTNVDACWPLIEAGAEAIVSTASGCGLMFKDYASLLADDAEYAARARRMQELVRDPVEIVTESLSVRPILDAAGLRVAVHCPCTQRNGLRLAGRVEAVLRALGFALCAVEDEHLCCGSAGTYSLLEPAIAGQLLERKVRALQGGHPDVIATANIGCLLHLERNASVPVKHWLELVATLIPT